MRTGVHRSSATAANQRPGSRKGSATNSTERGASLSGTLQKRGTPRAASGAKVISEFYPSKTANFKFSNLFKEKPGTGLNGTLTTKGAGVSENTKRLISTIEHRSSSKTACDRAQMIYQNGSVVGSPKTAVKPANFLLGVEEKEAFLAMGTTNTNHHPQRFKAGFGGGMHAVRGGDRRRSNTRANSHSRPSSAKRENGEKRWGTTFAK